MNVYGSGSNGGAPDEPSTSAGNGLVAARSFLVRALLERDARDAPPTWHGFVTDAESGERRGWRRTKEVSRFIERHLATGPGRSVRLEIAGDVMAGPSLTGVVRDMLTKLGDGRLHPDATLPDPNVTLERVGERLVGLGNQRGSEPTTSLGTRTLRGGRLEARARFQLWGATAPDVDTAVLTLHTDLLDDREELRQEGFLRLSAADTTLAEHVDSADAWRKATSFDVLYEYAYPDPDDADSLISRILVTTDPETVGSHGREQSTLSDHVVRWDEDLAEPLDLGGPLTVHRISALVHELGPAVGGTVTVLRSVHESPGPIAVHADLDAFLDAVAGDGPGQSSDQVTMAPADLWTALGPTGDVLELGDLTVDGTPDAYAGFDRPVSPPLVLATSADRLSISYTPPPGPATGLDQTAVIYLRVNAP